MKRRKVQNQNASALIKVKEEAVASKIDGIKFIMNESNLSQRDKKIFDQNKDTKEIQAIIRSFNELQDLQDFLESVQIFISVYNEINSQFTDFESLIKATRFDREKQLNLYTLFSNGDPRVQAVWNSYKLSKNFMDAQESLVILSEIIELLKPAQTQTHTPAIANGMKSLAKDEEFSQTSSNDWEGDYENGESEPDEEYENEH